MSDLSTRRWLVAPFLLVPLALGPLACSKTNDVTPPPAACANGVLDDGEGDIDCGGSCASKCKLGQSCNLDGDCATALCSQHLCVNASCSDSRMDGDETDQDCGGLSCKPCEDGKHCKVNGDCATSFCTGGVCKSPTCSDSEKNGTESDVDCGGTCRNEGKLCADGRSCVLPEDCQSGVCTGNVCKPPNCTDGVQNQGECAPDKGGPCQGKCSYDQPCTVAGDCETGVCRADGKCGCATKADCTGNDTECGWRQCTSGTCSMAYAPQGTALSQQTAGDCLQVECDGAGAPVSVNDTSDLPTVGECTTAQCSAGNPSVPVIAQKTAGTACTGTDHVCDGAGTCATHGKYDEDNFDEVLFAP